MDGLHLDLFSEETKNLILLVKSELHHIESSPLIINNSELIKEHRLDCFFSNEIIKQKFSQENEKKLIIRKQRLTKKALHQQVFLSGLDKSLAEINVPFIVLKGIPLNFMLYGNRLVRTARDVDILIDSKNFWAVHNKLKEAGFVSYAPDFELKKKHLPLIFKDFYQTAYYSKKYNVAIEIHWQLFRDDSQLSILNSEIWDTSKYIKVGNTRIRTLSDKLNLLYISLHHGKHNWDSIIWILDIFKLMQDMEQTELEQLLFSSKELGIEKPLVLGAYVADKLFGLKHSHIIRPYYSNSIIKLGLLTVPYINREDLNWVQRLYRRIQYEHLLSTSVLSKKSRLFTYPMYCMNYLILPTKLSRLYWFIKPIMILMKKLSKSKS